MAKGPNPTDQQLQFVDLVSQNQGIIRKVVSFWRRSPEDREELVQQILLETWRSFHSWDANRKFSTWLYRVALNVAISDLKKSRRGRNVSVGDELDCFVETEATSPELLEQIAELHCVIDQLLPLDRSLMLLYLEDCSYRDIAEILGITESNVATKISRLKNRIKQKLNPTTEE